MCIERSSILAAIGKSGPRYIRRGLAVTGENPVGNPARLDRNLDIARELLGFLARRVKRIDRSARVSNPTGNRGAPVSPVVLVARVHACGS